MGTQKWNPGAQTVSHKCMHPASSALCWSFEARGQFWRQERGAPPELTKVKFLPWASAIRLADKKLNSTREKKNRTGLHLCVCCLIAHVTRFHPGSLFWFIIVTCDLGWGFLPPIPGPGENGLPWGGWGRGEHWRDLMAELAPENPWNPGSTFVRRERPCVVRGQIHLWRLKWLMTYKLFLLLSFS